MADEDLRMRKLATAFYLFLVLLGIFFYFAWGLVYGTWDLTRADNMGVYALPILLVGFGITGFLLYRTPAPKPAKGEK